MTFCIGWKDRNFGYIVADSAATGTRAPRAVLSSFGEAHPNGSVDRSVEQAVAMPVRDEYAVFEQIIYAVHGEVVIAADPHDFAPLLAGHGVKLKHVGFGRLESQGTEIGGVSVENNPLESRQQRAQHAGVHDARAAPAGMKIGKDNRAHGHGLSCRRSRVLVAFAYSFANCRNTVCRIPPLR